MVKTLVFDTFDKAVERQLQQFIELFDNTLASTFSNPWVFLKRASTQIDEGSLEDVCLPSFEDTKERIPSEIESRSGIDTILQKWLASIPQEPSMIDDAVDKAQMLLLKTFQFIRAQVADQIELFAESFFKLPMMRRLEEDMASIELSDMDKEGHAARLEALQLEFDTVRHEYLAVGECIEKLQAFALKAQSKLRTRKRDRQVWLTRQSHNTMSSDKRPRGRGRGDDEDRYTGDLGRFERLDGEGSASGSSFAKDLMAKDEAAKSVEGWVIVIAGIHEETQEEDLYERFSEYGAIKNIHLNLDRRTGYVKGYCFLEYASQDEAWSAIRDENGNELLGNQMQVSWAFTKGGSDRKRAKR
eukprot:g12792.t1